MYDRVSNNHCYNNRGNGISEQGGPSIPGPSLISNNYCYDNDLNGISGKYYVHIENNNSYNNHTNGIYYFGVAPCIEGNTVGNGTDEPGNIGSGLLVDSNSEIQPYPYSSTISKNTIIGNAQNGITFTNKSYGDCAYGNTILNNGSYGIYFAAVSKPDFGGGACASPGNNTISGNGTYDLYKTGTNNVYAKYNHWDTTTEAQMAAGFQKKTNITRFYDAFDYWQPGNPLSGAFIWSSGFPKNGKLEFTAKNKNSVQPASLGKLKAAYAR